jgi:hypothetical protein
MELRERKTNKKMMKKMRIESYTVTKKNKNMKRSREAM